MARSIGLDIEATFAEAIQHSSLKRKIKHDVPKREAKKRKISETQAVKCADEEKEHEKLEPTTTPDTQKVDDDIQIASSSTVARIDFKVNEVIWAKIKGHVHWPAKVKCFPSNKMVVVVWFNDYRTTKIYKTQMFKFLQNFDLYAKNFDSTIGLECAAKEALIYYGSNIFK